MKTMTRRLLYWTPRALGIFFAVFMALFALDVFGEDHGFWGTVAALLIHLIPACVVVIALAISCRWNLVGAALFAGLAVFYVVWAWGIFPAVAYISISGPLMVMGVLFLLNWIFRGQLRAR
jgi:hypothetical protein